MKKSLTLAALAVVTALALTCTPIKAHARAIGTWMYDVLIVTVPETHTGSETHSGPVSFTGAVSMTGSHTLPTQTLAQLQILAPIVGQEAYCTNCAPPKIVVGTGTSAGNWADAVGAGFK